jgi:TolB-like protein
MTSSRSSSNSRLPSRFAWCAALALASLAGCRPGPRPAPPELLAVFPVQNASGGSAPIRGLTEALDAALDATGLQIVPRQDLDAVLARNRIRFTGGVDRRMAKVLREELGVGAVLVPTLEQYSAENPPKVAIAVRLVKNDERPVVLWADAFARAGNDSPGLLGVGLVTSPAELQRTVIADVARSVERHIAKQAMGELCGSAGRFTPRRSFRAPVLDDVGRRSIAVLPFRNASPRRGAGEVVLNQFVAQLARSGAFEVLDPGVVREELLGHRIVLEQGVSVDQAIAMLDLLKADLVLSGFVQVYEAPSGPQTPKIEFTAFVLDRRTAELVWSSASHGDGDDGVFFFGAGRVYTASELSCRMVHGVVDRIIGRRPRLAASD